MGDGAELLATRKRELERRLAELSPERRVLLERAWDTGSEPVPDPLSPQAIPRREPGATAPMSFAQELLWLLERTTPGHAYNVPRTVRLQGRLDTDALQRALDVVASRHEALRTTFHLIDEFPSQVVHAAAPVPIQRIDIGDLPADKRDAAARRRVREIVSAPFDLERDLQLRASLIRLADDDHVLVLVSHHIVSDGGSGGIVMRELEQLYKRFVDGAAPGLAMPVLQYADYAVWQRQQLSGKRLDALLGFWREQLAGAPPTLGLPTDRPRPATQSYDGAWRSFALPASTLDRVRELARTSGTTTFMVLLAALDVMLQRYTGENEIVVGAPMAGRLLPELEGVVGFFANTLLFRASLAGDPTFLELLGRVRAACLAAYDHQDVPLEKLMLERGANGEPIAGAPQVVLITDDPDRHSIQLPGLVSTPFGVSRGAAKFDLSLRVAEQLDRTVLTLEYRTALFDATTIDRMLAHLGILLASATELPAARISDLALMSPDERETVLETWNDTRGPDTVEQRIDDLFAEQVSHSPDVVALNFESIALTYRELDRLAEVLAARLRTLGVGPDTLVGICVPRSVELVVAVLGILKAGAAYVPLDPDYPADRLAFILADSGANVVVSHRSVEANVPATAAQMVWIAASGSELVITAPETIGDSRHAGDQGRRASPRDLAYVIYTSGSTGRPKGVEIEHRSVVSFLHGMRKLAPLAGNHVLVAVTPISFDISVLELLLPLISGARVVVASQEQAFDPHALAALLDRAGATHLQATPSTWRMLIDAGWQGRAGLTALCGGEALPQSLADALVARGVDLWNLYGPTEATIWATAEHVTETGQPIGIGRPMENVRAYVLDAANKPVPIGVPGELWLAGAGLARGYHGRADLTAERFIPEPFSGIAGARMYRTGDRARWRSDGTLEYLGRLDFQVKLRGHRIELGEIEAALLAQPGVTAAVVTLREDVPGNPRLVAYVVMVGDARPGADELREALRARLSAVMLPSAIEVLDALPLTPNGKIDRKALPAPTADVHAEDSGYVAPWSPMEQEIAAIWSALLGVGRVGVNDDFFERGGNSLLAMRMFAEIERVWGRRLPFRSFFERPTIAEVVKVMVSAAREDEASGIAVLQEGGTGIPLAFVHGDVLGHGWFCRRLAPLIGPAPMYVLPTVGPGTPGSPLTIEAMARFHVDSVKRLQPEGPYRVGGYCHGGLVAYEMARLLRENGDAVDAVILVDAFCSNIRWRKIAPLLDFVTHAPTSEGRLIRRARLHYRLHYYSHRLRQLRRMAWSEKRTWTITVARRALGLRPAASIETSDNAVSAPNAAPAEGLGPVGQFVARAQRGYMPGPYPGRVELIWASRAVQGRRTSAGYGWEHVAEDVESHVVDGSHVSIVMAEGIGALGRQIKESLNRNQVA